MIAQWAIEECRSKYQQALHTVANVHRELNTMSCPGWEGSAADGARHELQHRVNGVGAIIQEMGDIRYDLIHLEDEILHRMTVLSL